MCKVNRSKKQNQKQQAIRDFANQGVAVVIVVHDINLVARYADKLLVLACGEVIAHGEPSNIITRALMKRLYHIDVDVIQHPQTGSPLVVI